MRIDLYSPNAPIEDALREEALSLLRAALDRFERTVREVRATLRDDNGPKGGVDKRCLVRLRFLPRGEAVISKSAAEVLSAVALAAQGAKEAVARRAGRRGTRARAARTAAHRRQSRQERKSSGAALHS